MKDILTFVLLVACLLLTGKTIKLSRDIKDLEQKNIVIDQKLLDNEIKFKWSEYEEDIPADGSLIKIKYTDENTIYIGTVDTIVNNPLIMYPTNY